MKSHDSMSEEIVPAMTVHPVQQVHDAAGVVDRVYLDTISFVELNAERLLESEGTGDEGQRYSRLLIRETEEEVFGRVALTVEMPDSEFFLDIMAVYVKKEAFELVGDAGREFLEKVVIFAVWPYLRAELQSLCDSLLVERIVLPTIRQGEIRVSEHEPNS